MNNEKDYEQETLAIRVPKGFGNIENISDQDEFYPWLAKKVADYDEFGNPIYEDIGSFETFNESLLALLTVNSIAKSNKKIGKRLTEEREYLEEVAGSLAHKVQNRFTLNVGNELSAMDHLENTRFTPRRYDPALDYDNPLMKLTLKEVYERWYHDKQFQDVTKHTMENYENTYKKVAHLNDRVFVEIKFSEIEACVQHEKAIGNSFSMRKRVKLFFSQLYQWAISHEMCTSNLALNIKLGKNERESTRKPFTIQQIKTLFAHVDENIFIEEVLMLIFTGCRIGEFLNIRREDIHMDQRYFVVTESKTKAGRNRMVPIHKKVVRFFRKRLRAKSDWLIHDARGRKVEYKDFSAKFKKCMNRFGFEGLSCHCCRHTLATLLHSSGADPTTARRILGHVQSDDVHGRVYVHVLLKDLLRAIDLI